MDKLIQTFLIKILAGFFKKAISSFKVETEDINHYIEDKDYSQFSELARIGMYRSKILTNSLFLPVSIMEYCQSVLLRKSNLKSQN